MSGNTNPQGNLLQQGNMQFDWWANASVNIPIILSVVGFVIAVILLNPGCNHNNYHDTIVQNKRELVSTLYANRISRLTTEKAKYEGLYSIQRSKDDSTRVRDSLLKISSALLATEYNGAWLKYSNVDTNLKFFTKYFYVDRDTFTSAIRSLVKDTVCTVQATLIDTAYFSRSTNATARLTLKKEGAELISLFDKYPTLGFWFFFSIAQMTLWFLLVALSIGVARSTDNISNSLTYESKNTFLFFLLPTVAILAFFILLYYTIIRNYVIEDSYLLDNYNALMGVYSFFGYLVTVVCFGNYLFLSNKLELLDNDAKAQNIDLKNDTVFKANYQQIKNAFDRTFLFTSIILSVFVVWIGLLFNSINDIEAMKFYSFLSGRPFLNYNFVYLIGLIHTLLLLIFYVPVRIRFNAMETARQEDANANEGKSSPKKFLTAVWESLGTILITTSPLITTLLQNLITNIAG